MPSITPARLAVATGSLCLLVAACASDSGPECVVDEDCVAGRYCDEGRCTYECLKDSDCPPGDACNARGRCRPGCAVTNGGVEACDEQDNDCDGETDEGFERVGTPCGNPGCPGIWVCAADGSDAVCDAPEPAPDDTSCDGVDDDCDGETDEDAADQPCPLQDGVCAGSAETCLPGGAWSGCDYGPFHTEGIDDTCDERDNDCDGVSDEDAAPVPVPEIGDEALDGRDNNCNGLVDEPGGVMVPLPDASAVWIDAHEIIVAENPDCTGTRYGVGADDYPAGFPPDGSPTIELYACSLPGALPSGHLSWYRARAACEAQGKRLCSRNEWGAACTGGVWQNYPYGSNLVPSACNYALSGPGHPTVTGAYQDCTSGDGTFDQNGNLHEWLQDWSTQDPNGALGGGFGYACEVCRLVAGVSVCDPCDPDNPAHLQTVEDISDCNIGDTERSRFPRDTVYAWLGTRCCYDSP